MIPLVPLIMAFTSIEDLNSQDTVIRTSPMFPLILNSVVRYALLFLLEINFLSFFQQERCPIV